MQPLRIRTRCYLVRPQARREIVATDLPTSTAAHALYPWSDRRSLISRYVKYPATAKPRLGCLLLTFVQALRCQFLLEIHLFVQTALQTLMPKIDTAQVQELRSMANKKLLLRFISSGKALNSWCYILCVGYYREVSRRARLSAGSRDGVPRLSYCMVHDII
jgi:hypothetical protein